MHNQYRLVRQPDARVRGGDSRIVPVLHLPEEDVSEKFAGETELSGGDTVQIHHRHDGAHHNRNCANPSRNS